MPYYDKPKHGITCHMDNPNEIKAQLKVFGKNLKRARMTRNITLETLAERADLNIRTLQRFEAGESNVLVTTLARLRRGIGCTWDELLTD